VRAGLAIEEEPEEEPEVRPRTANGTKLTHARTSSIGNASLHSLAPGGPGSGLATFTVVSTSKYPPSADVYVVVRQLTPRDKVIGKTKHRESATGIVNFDETFKVTCTPDAQFRVEVYNHRTFGSDEKLAEILYVVDESGSGEKEWKVGSGTVTMKSAFAETRVESPPRSSMRRSLLSKRESVRPSREGTPT
jgi:hypothetical protein